MSVQNRLRPIGVVIVFLGMMCASVSQASPGPILFVVPARPLAVTFAQDIAKLRSCFVLSYQARPAEQPPLLHVWDGQGSRWIEIDISQYRAGSLFATTPAAVVFMGTDSEFPSVLRTSKAWTAHELRLPTFNMGENVNQCHRLCSFTPREWQWLAGRYQLKIEDRNEDRRRYGRYGRPGQPPTSPVLSEDRPEVQETFVPPPSPVQKMDVVKDEPIVTELPAAPEVASDPKVPEVPAWVPTAPDIDPGRK